MNGRQRVLAHLAGESTDRLPLMPITMMFAADQIGSRYGEYVRDHRVLVEAQMRTAESFEIDHVSCISDPAREAADCGAQIRYFDDQPPAIVEEAALLSNKMELLRLRIPDPLGGGRMTDRVRAAALFRERVTGQRLIEGWIEGPCAEGADLRGIHALMLDFNDDPRFVKDLFAFVVEMELKFARAQVDAGVDIMGVGDAAASLVGPRIYQEFIWPYEKQLVDALHAMGIPVRLHICGDTRHILEGMGRLGCEIVDLDYPSSLGEARLKMGSDQVLLGNIHPVAILRNGTPTEVVRAVEECRHQAGIRFIVGAGCEVPRGTPENNIRAMASCCRSDRATLAESPAL